MYKKNKTKGREGWCLDRHISHYFMSQKMSTKKLGVEQSQKEDNDQAMCVLREDVSSFREDSSSSPVQKAQKSCSVDTLYLA